MMVNVEVKDDNQPEKYDPASDPWLFLFGGLLLVVGAMVVADRLFLDLF